MIKFNTPRDTPPQSPIHHGPMTMSDLGRAGRSLAVTPIAFPTDIAAKTSRDNSTRRDAAPRTAPLRSGALSLAGLPLVGDANAHASSPQRRLYEILTKSNAKFGPDGTVIPPWNEDGARRKASARDGRGRTRKAEPTDQHRASRNKLTARKLKVKDVADQMHALTLDSELPFPMELD